MSSPMSGRGRGVAAACVASLLVLPPACGGSDDGRVVVFAASSLTEVFESIEEQYEDRFPGVDVVINTAGSTSLVAQLADGAPADVLATADGRTMQLGLEAGVDVADSGRSTEVFPEPVVFARNQLVIAVESGNPLAITGVADLVAGDGDDDVVVVLAAPEVPAGAYAAEVLACSGVEVEAASLEQNVRAAAAKVVLGEADAALVYATDVTDDLEAVALDPSCAVDVAYPIVALSEADAAQAFVDFVTGPEGAAILAAEGFSAP